ncbi:hypothetical protein W97_06370 [Coniosporium apollinis CBS 100218]|uniref:DUF2828 domain-containing protein n=1 Tax=Coniosporium apollinis (strain CBS 100218) TaxID=1168221 RepID=R7YZ09_CONA1|nr:uncharacterized protein W97_06370 [Coniosporium apollinis CBS 100218]EON67117.1 hypothetical protein W97_06370 [Coniosporium apollinis CBS 100218]
MADTASKKLATSSIDSSFPVSVPCVDALAFHDAGFEAYLCETLREYVAWRADAPSSPAHVSETTGTDIQVDEKTFDAQLSANGGLPASIDLHVDHDSGNSAHLPEDMVAEGKMLTENADLTYRTTQSPLVDLFFSLEKQIAPEKLQSLLDASWNEDPLTTLKIIWSGRSIHLGRGERGTFYRCVGWLAKHHPLTALLNLKWLARPVIEKKVVKKEDADLDAIIVNAPEDVEGDGQWLVRNGVSHGYWKDLLNILVLAVNKHLGVLKDPALVLNMKNKQPKKRKFNSTKDEVKENRHAQEQERHQKFLDRFDHDGFYNVLHLNVARLFAEQLRADMKLLDSGDKKALRRISLCAKWAPSLERFHDKHTFIASTIAEMLYPQTELDPTLTDREMYLKHAREAYRSRTLAPLRKALAVVERDITAENFSAIKYERVPSLAMDRYKLLFAQKDFDHFSAYLEDVTSGKARISGAVLTPATLVHQATQLYLPPEPPSDASDPDARLTTKQRLVAKLNRVTAQTLNGQWNAIVQRMRDSGTLENSIAVADVSGSMTWPTFADGTRPMDSAIGLALLVAELTAPPFGGAFITFSSTPEIVRVDRPEGGRDFVQRVHATANASWGMSTDFVAVFEKLILPLAIENNVPAEQMVKRVFVFSDMHFDAAQPPEASLSAPRSPSSVPSVPLPSSPTSPMSPGLMSSSSPPFPPSPSLQSTAPEQTSERWSTSFERIQKKFKDAGYEMPELVYWNLAGARPDAVEQGAPMPVKADEPGCALVSGYSQAMMKMFLEGGGFEDPDEGDKMEVIEKTVVLDEEGNEGEEVVTREEKKDPMSYVRKGVGHRAYEMLKVYD